jgi:D-alanine-D-alanine ligase
MHGTNGEDGTIAGFLNLLGIPYIGPDILASSVGMDKILMKKVLKESGLPVVDYVSFYSMEYMKDEEKIQKEIKEKLRFPVIVKAGNLGSSVGIKKARNEHELAEAIEFSMEFSDRVLVENAVENLKEINCSVMGNLSESETSVCEEPFFSDEILSYADKYMGGNAAKGTKGMKGMAGAKGGLGAKSGGKGMAISDKKLPADISDEKRDEIQKLTKETFRVLGCSGVARVDFLMDKDTEKVYVNEINTIPGALSYYLWEATGKTFEQELDELVNIALKRHREREKLTFSYDQNILAMQGNPGVKGAKGMKGTKVAKK